MKKKDKKLIKQQVAQQLAMLSRSGPTSLKPAMTEAKIVTTQLFAEHEYKYVTKDLFRLGIIVGILAIFLAGFFIVNIKTNYLTILAERLLKWVGF
jgi:hypothetical protein